METERPRCACGRLREKQGGGRTDYRATCSRCRNRRYRKHGTPEDYQANRRAQYASKQEQWRAEGRECSGCGETKPWPEEFYPTQGKCKKCFTADVRKNNDANMADEIRRWHRKLQGFVATLKREYGLDYLDYLTLLDEQDYRCAICRGTERGSKGRRWCVDHDHTSGFVRALLCGPCNTGIGFLGDDPARLDAAAEYLRKRGLAPALGIAARVADPTAI